MDNPEKLATRRRQTKQKRNTICVEHHYTQANTNNVIEIVTDITTRNSERKDT